MMWRDTVKAAAALTLVLGLLPAPEAGAQEKKQSFVPEGKECAGRLGRSGREAGPWLGPDQELAESMFAYFEMATGADVVYAGSDSFEQQIVIDLQAGSPPNLAVFPQPGLAANMAAQGFLTPLGDESLHDVSWLVSSVKLCNPFL